MKVLYISRGLEDYVIELLNGMCKQVEVHVALAAQDEWIVEHLDPRIKVLLVRSPRVRDWKNIFVLARLRRYINMLRPDVIHLQSGVVWELLVSRMMRRIPTVLTVHDVTRHPTHGRQVAVPQRTLDYALRICDGIIVHGPTLEKIAQHHCNSLRVSKPIRSIPLGILSRYGRGRGSVRPKTMTVLLFGTLDKYKGIEYLIHAEKAIRKRLTNVRIVIAGKSAAPGYYESLVEPEQRIEILAGRKSDSEVRTLFESADVLVLPYIEASQSGVLQVGFSFGVPPIVTTVGALTDVIKNGYNGLTIPPMDSEQLANAICELLTNEGLRERVIDNLVKERKSIFHWDTIALETRQFYEGVILDKALKQHAG